MYTIEAIIACILILAFNLFVSSYVTSTRSSPSAKQLQRVGQDALSTLAENGDLANFVEEAKSDSNQFYDLDTRVGYLIHVQVADIGYNLRLKKINPSGSTSLLASWTETNRPVPIGADVVSVNYYLSGCNYTYEPRIVELDLWHMGGVG